MKQGLLDNSLNPAQLAAATAKLGNLLILAGAGSGKTRVLVHRILWLIITQDAPLTSILAVTFTNKAAAEMRIRLAEQLQCDPSGMWIGTFHGLAHKMLRINWSASKLPQDFRVMDSEDQLRLIKRIFKKLSINEERWEPKQVQNFINRKKDEGLRVSNLEKANNPYEKVMLEIYKVYEDTCRQEGLVDFSELLLCSYELLNTNAEIRQHYQQKFVHFFVDEFQDTNKIQYAWLKLLTAHSASVTVVGDDDQSIYGWRGACVENIYQFERDFSAPEVLRLEQNYRSTGTILAAANAVIARNGGRYQKTLWTDAGSGEPISLYVALNEEDEALYIVNQLQKYKAAGGSLIETAILYRSNAQSRVLEEMLLRAGIEYSIYGGLRFFERAEVKDALANLILILNRHDNAAFDRAINTPPRGVGARSLEKIRELAAEQGISWWDAAKVAVGNSVVTGKAASGISAFVTLVDAWEQALEALPLADIIARIIKESGLLQFFQSQASEVARSRIENLEELVNAAGDFAKNLLADSSSSLGVRAVDAGVLVGAEQRTIVAEFLSFTALDTGGKQDERNGVQMMTLHSAKGLEFPVVFMCGVEEGLFPHHFSKDDPQALEEERRLCYVGITRAKQKLVMTYAEVRRLFGREESRKVSRFITEIPSALIEEERRRMIIKPVQGWSAQNSNSMNNSSVGNKNNYRGKNYNSGFNKNYNYSVAKSNSTTNNSNPDMASVYSNSRKVADPNSWIGRKVKHSRFGNGVVLDQEGSAEKTRIHVQFDKVGTKWLVLAYASLEVC